MRPRRRVAGDEGFTLIEVLIAVALLGAGAVTGLAALATLSSSSSLSRDTSQAQTVLYAASQSLLDEGRNPYDADCSPTYNPTVGIALPTTPRAWLGSSITVTGIEFWNGTTFGATCYDSSPFARIQRITLRVQSPDGRVSKSLTILKRGV